MRTINFPARFRRDYKRTRANPQHRDIDEILSAVLSLLTEDNPLAARYCDHALTGDLAGFRECHLKPDLLLVYQTEGEDKLTLARLGTHSQLGF